MILAAILDLLKTVSSGSEGQGCPSLYLSLPLPFIIPLFTLHLTVMQYNVMPAIWPTCINYLHNWPLTGSGANWTDTQIDGYR